MVKIIPNNSRRGFGSAFLESFNKNLKLPKFNVDLDGKQKAIDKRVKDARKFSDDALKRFHPGIYENEKPYNSFNDRMKQYVHQGYSDDDALRASLADISKQRAESGGTLPGEAKKPGHGTADREKFVGGAVGNAIEGFKESPGLKKYAGDQSVFQRFGEFNKALGSSAAEHGKDIAANPGKFAAELGSGIGNVLAWPVDVLEAGLRRGGFIDENTDPNILRQGLNKVQNWIREGKSPEEIDRSLKREVAAGFIPIGPLIKGAQWLSSKFGGKPPLGNNPVSGISKNLRSDVNRANEVLKKRQENILSEDLFTDMFGRPKQTNVPPAAKAAANAQAQAPLAGRASAAEEVSTTGKPNATVSRMARSGPEGKIFRTAEQAALREKQLQLHPEYAEEIAQDSAARAARAEAREPKTEVGQAGLAKRMAKAEADLPKAKELYQKAIARVRGLESEMSRGVLPQEQARFDSLYKAAVNELNESEFYLKTVLNNAKTGEARIGVDGMRQAARNKMINLEQQIDAGEIPKLSLKDYNPEFIRQAKALQKKKPVPSTRHDDYFTQVHDAYANEYRNRINTLNKPADPKDLSSSFRPKNVEKTKETLQKMVDHIEAENTIHRHKMGLREIEQRKVAKDRLGKFTKQAGEEKVKRLAKDALKSPEKAAEATDAAFEEAAHRARDETVRQKILSEREAVKKRLEKEAAYQQERGGKGGNQATTKKEAVRKGRSITNDLRELMDSLKGEGKNFFKTNIGKDFLIGVGTELLTQATKGDELPFSPSTVGTLIGGYGAGYRYIFSKMTRYFWHKGQKADYKRALREGDDQKLIELREKMGPKLRKEAIKEYQEESNF